ncbi:MAG: ABC transporter ATP-binding protein, partial [Phaeodactylibacter sp.]|nr:ABC transporter ATP-binding protein [Phaeodactylibacter sp.]
MSQKSTKSKNPYLALMGIAWKYAKGERRQYLLVYLMFTISSIVDALNPIIWGLFINAVQVQGADVLHSAWVYVGIYLIVRLVDWIFHGFARVKECRLAFNLSRNYLQEMYH